MAPRTCRRPLAAALALAASLAAAGPAAAAEPPRVVASIAPVHSLASAVMAGVASPALIVRGYGSPHNWQLRPSEAAALAGADIVLWIGEPLETFLVKPLAALDPGTLRVALIDAAGVRALPTRAAGGWHEDGQDHDHDAHGRVDAHIWLSPDNAKAMARAIAAALSRRDPERAGAYRDNEARVIARLDRLDRALRARLAPVRESPFVVLHDGYQYLEDHFDLDAIGAITVGFERPPGARHLRALNARIRASGARCIFAEPQFDSPLVETLVAGTGARSATLDPIGAALAPGPNAYFEMMERLADSIADCLSGAPESP